VSFKAPHCANGLIFPKPLPVVVKANFDPLFWDSTILKKVFFVRNSTTVKFITATANSRQLSLHISLLTYSMQQSPSLEANHFSASQKIPLIL
jgi:hypothetical protein